MDLIHRIYRRYRLNCSSTCSTPASSVTVLCALASWHLARSVWQFTHQTGWWSHPVLVLSFDSCSLIRKAGSSSSMREKRYPCPSKSSQHGWHRPSTLRGMAPLNSSHWRHKTSVASLDEVANLIAFLLLLDFTLNATPSAIFHLLFVIEFCVGA